MKKDIIIVSELKKRISYNEKLIELLSTNNEEYRRTLAIIEKDTIPYEALENLSSTDIIKSLETAEHHPNYPFDGSLIPKLRYTEDLTLRFWRAKDTTDIIKKIEGKKAAKTLMHLPQKLNYLVKKGDLICLKYNNSNFYTFYTTRKDWVQNISIKNKQLYAEVVPGHEPQPQLLKNLTHEQKASLNIKWAGFKA